MHLCTRNLFWGAWIVTWKNISNFETYTRYSRVDDEDQKKIRKKKSLSGGLWSFFEISLGNPALDIAEISNLY